MNVFFAIDPEAVEMDGHDLSASVVAHKALIREWRSYGALVHSGPGWNDCALATAIQGLPVSVRSIWVAALRQNKLHMLTKAWDGVINDQASATLVGEIDLALLETTRATELAGLDDEKCSGYSSKWPGIELCRFHAFTESVAVSAARQTATTSLMAGADAAQEWDRRYGRWIRGCSHAALVDRYALKNHVFCKRNGDVSGLWRALSGFYARAAEKRVSIDIFIGNQDVSMSDIGNFQTEIFDNLKNGGIRKLRLIVSPDEIFRDCCHSRYMRCDYSVFGMDKGFQSYSGVKVAANDTIWRGDRVSDPLFDNAERCLLENALHCENIIG